MFNLSVFGGGLAGPICSILSSLTWAVGVSAYSKLSKVHPPFKVNFARALVAFPLFLLTLLLVGGPHGFAHALSSVSRSHFLWLSVSVVSSFAIGDVLFLMSTESLGVPSALAIASVFPVWSAIAGLIFKHEVLSIKQVSGLIAVVAGVILVILSQHAPDLSTQKQKVKWIHNYWVGIGLVFLASAFWSLNTFGVALGGVGLEPAAASAVRMGIAVIFCPVVGWLFMGKVTNPLLPSKLFRKNLWIFILEGFGGSLFFMYGLTHSKIAVASALSSLAPVLSLPIALILKTDRLSFQKTLGIFLVVGGIWYLVGG
jgi:drug/metabolite transporter (DMT)-like permease